jgi:hypothetical protein
MGTDQDGSSGLQGFDHVLTTLIHGAGEALADENKRGLGIPGTELSCGIEQERILAQGSSLGSEAAGDSKSA